MSIAPGSRVGPYEIVSAPGQGGMGAVYRARDSKLNRDVAISEKEEAETPAWMADGRHLTCTTSALTVSDS
jgi:hypothetical protein